jgi:two-component system, NarL family, response regulator LiaR
VRVLVLTSFQEGDLIRTALQAGAIGYLLKDVDIDELAGAVRSAYAGQTTLAKAATQALVEPPAARAGPGEALTDRQREVLALVAAGMSNPEIAERLVVSLPTVRFHVSTILAKLGASNRAEAAALAVKYNLFN